MARPSKKKTVRKKTKRGAPARRTLWYEALQPQLLPALKPLIEGLLHRGVSSRADLQRQFCDTYNCTVSTETFNGWLTATGYMDLFRQTRVTLAGVLSRPELSAVIAQNVPVPADGLSTQPPIRSTAPHLTVSDLPGPIDTLPRDEEGDPLPLDVYDGAGIPEPMRRAAIESANRPVPSLNDRPNHALPVYSHKSEAATAEQ